MGHVGCSCRRAGIPASLSSVIRPSMGSYGTILKTIRLHASREGFPEGERLSGVADCSMERVEPSDLGPMEYLPIQFGK